MKIFCILILLFIYNVEMKLINRKEFIDIKRPVIFSYYNDNDILLDCENLYLKYENCGSDDFCVINLLKEVWFQYEDMVWSWGTENILYAIDELEKWNIIRLDLQCWWRDGMFDYNQKFLIYDDIDIINLINTLKQCLIQPL